MFLYDYDVHKTTSRVLKSELYDNHHLFCNFNANFLGCTCEKLVYTCKYIVNGVKLVVYPTYLGVAYLKDWCCLDFHIGPNEFPIPNKNAYHKVL